MEVTLEKLDIVRERTGASYSEAREALVACNGDVIDALVFLEERLKEKASKASDSVTDEIIDKMKTLWAKGVDTKVKLVRNDETVFDMPLTAGLIGAIVAPQVALASAIIAYAAKYSIAIEKPRKQEKHSTATADVEPVVPDAGAPNLN